MIDNKEIVINVCSYIEGHLEEKISIEKLSGMFYLSREQFYRIFNKMAGVSPALFIQKKKIDASKKMLKESRLKISEISLILGYSNQSSFVRAFKKVTGILPKQYRNMSKNEGNDTKR